MEIVITSGLMAALFVGLLIYVLRDSAKREEKYQETIKQLHDCLSVVKEIKKDVVEIKKKVGGKSNEKLFQGDLELGQENRRKSKAN